MKKLRCNRGLVSVTGKSKSFQYRVGLLVQAAVDAELAPGGGYAAPRSASSGQIKFQRVGNRSLRVTAPPLSRSIATASSGPNAERTDNALRR